MGHLSPESEPPHAPADAIIGLIVRIHNPRRLESENIVIFTSASFNAGSSRSGLTPPSQTLVCGANLTEWGSVAGYVIMFLRSAVAGDARDTRCALNPGEAGRTRTDLDMTPIEITLGPTSDASEAG